MENELMPNAIEMIVQLARENERLKIELESYRQEREWMLKASTKEEQQKALPKVHIELQPAPDSPFAPAKPARTTKKT